MFKSHVFKWAVIVPLMAIGALALLVVVIGGIVSLVETTGSSFTLSSGAYPSTVLSDAAGDARSFLAMDEDLAYAESESTTLYPVEEEKVLLDDGTVVETKIIKTGSLELVVDDANEAGSLMGQIAEQNSGYVQSSNYYERTDGTRSGTIVIRVPVESFDTVMEGAKGYANVVERESISADDVTEDYVDILARLHNAEAQEEAFLDILDLATDVEDILAVQRELLYVREMIEVYQGRLNYLESQTSFSTITITLSEEPTIEIGGKTFRPGTTVKQAAQAVVLIAQGLVTFVIWLVIIGGGIGIPVALIVWLIVWLYQRRKHRS